MSKFHNNWRKFLTEGTFKEQRILREISEDEVGHIRKALDELGPEDLAFQQIFGDKARLLIPFPTKDKESELGKFVEFFDKAGYNVDWNKGILSGEHQFMDASPEAIMALIRSQRRPLRAPDEREVKTKKVQMKVGKFFSKIDNLAKKVNKLIAEMIAGSPKGAQRAADSDGRAADDMIEKGELWRFLDGIAITNGLGDKAKDYYRALDQLRGLLNHNPSLIEQALRRENSLAQTMARYWQTNADFIKKNVDNLEGDTYSILITRHPIDVLRMSDFDDITSCHSPPSRGGAGSFYKCAVAEAHGHGALAYIVRTSDLEQEFGTRNINAINESSAFQQNEDFFYDEVRDTGGEIEPEGRLRLRQVRYFENGIGNAKRRDEGAQLAIPETSTYGKSIPGFQSAVDKWLSGVQGELVRHLAGGWTDGKPKVDFGKFIKYGGSYQDNSIGQLIKKVFNREHEGEVTYTGGVFDVKQDIETEDQLERELDFGGTAALRDAGERAIESVKQHLGDRLHEVSVDVEDEDGGYAVPEMIIKFVYEGANISEEQQSAGEVSSRYLADEIGEYGGNYDIFVPGGTYQTRFFVTAPGDPQSLVWRANESPKNDILITLIINFEKINEGVYSFADPEELESAMEDAAVIVRSLYEGYEMIIRKFLMREGVLGGGAIDELGRDAERGEYQFSGWDIETEEGDYEPNEYALVSATVPVEIEFDNTTKDVAQRIVADRNFWIQIRERILTKAREDIEVDRGYQVDYDRFVDEIDDQTKKIELRLNFYVGEDDKDEQVELFTEILKKWDPEDVQELVQGEFNKFARAMSPENPQTISEGRLRLRNRSREERMFDKWRRFLK